MKTVILLPFFALLILGAGCALSSAESEKQVRTEYQASPVAPLQAVEQEEGGAPMARKTETSEVPEDTALRREIEMASGNFFFKPAVINAKTEETFTVRFLETSGEHTFNIDELGIHEKIVSGESLTVTAPSLPGHYPYYCSLGANRTLGMEGMLVVE
jgi:plastocyanin